MTVFALLVIDIQQGLCIGPGAAFDVDGVITRINQLTAAAHAASMPVFLIQHESRSGTLARGSTGWQIAETLERRNHDRVIAKTTPDAFMATGLEAQLRALGVEELIICGMHSEYCIDTTTRRALALGWPVVLVADAHTTAGNAVLSPQQVIAHHNLTLTHIVSFGPQARALPTQRVVQMLRP